MFVQSYDNHPRGRGESIFVLISNVYFLCKFEYFQLKKKITTSSIFDKNVHNKNSFFFHPPLKATNLQINKKSSTDCSNYQTLTKKSYL